MNVLSAKAFSPFVGRTGILFKTKYHLSLKCIIFIRAMDNLNTLISFIILKFRVWLSRICRVGHFFTMSIAPLQSSE